MRGAGERIAGCVCAEKPNAQALVQNLNVSRAFPKKSRKNLPFSYCISREDVVYYIYSMVYYILNRSYEG